MHILGSNLSQSPQARNHNVSSSNNTPKKSLPNHSVHNYSDVIRRIQKESNYVSISTIPDTQGVGLNYTFIGDCIKKKEKYDPEELLEERRLIIRRNPRKASLLKNNSFVNKNNSPEVTPEASNRKDDEKVQLTIDTRMESATIDQSGDKDIDRSFFNDDMFAKRSNEIQTRDESDADQDEEDYIDGATPGPGSYDLGSSFDATRRGNTFMSKADRFKYPVREGQVLQGYDFQVPKKRKNKAKTLKPAHYKKYYPFQSSDVRFPPEKIPDGPGPAEYRPRESIQEKLIHNIQRDFKGKFGVQEQRFKSDKKDVPGPGAYFNTISHDPVIPLYFQPVTENANFRSHQKREIFKKSSVPGIGTYELSISSIGNKVPTYKAQLYDELPNKAPFGTNVPRGLEHKHSSLHIGTDSLDLLFQEQRPHASLHEQYQRQVVKGGLRQKNQRQQANSFAEGTTAAPVVKPIVPNFLKSK